MPARLKLAPVILAALLPLLALGQVPISSALTSLGVKLDPASLLAALADPRPAVRGMAASELAGQAYHPAIPAMHNALKNENDPLTRFNFAQALAALGDPAAEKLLLASCNDSAFDVGVRTLAATDLATYSHHYGCAPFMLSLLSSANDIERESALLYLSQIPPEHKDVTSFGPPLLAATRDQNAFFRSLAVKALLNLGDEPSKRAFLAAQPKNATR